MQRAKAFFVVCAGIFLLALAYHLGARSAGAQTPGNAAVGIASYYLSNCGLVTEVAAAGGDVYRHCDGQGWQYIGNAFSVATPVQQETLGGLKVKYR